MNELNPKTLESDLGLEGYGAVLVVADEEGGSHNFYLPFSQAEEFNGIIMRGSFNGMPVLEGARSIRPTSRRVLDMMKDGRTRRTAVLGYVKNEPEFPAPLDVLYRHRGSIWRRARGGRSARLQHGIETFKEEGLFVPPLRRFTISLADSSEYAFGLLPEVVIVDNDDGIRRTIRHSLEYEGLPSRYHSRLREYLQTL